MKFHTQLKAKDIFKFSLAYTYSGVQAILPIFWKSPPIALAIRFTEPI